MATYAFYEAEISNNLYLYKLCIEDLICWRASNQYFPLVLLNKSTVEVVAQMFTLDIGRAYENYSVYIGYK